MGNDVFLALGSNVGDREKNLSEAVKNISLLENTVLKGTSNIYETDPVGYAEQGRFLNMALGVSTGLEPLKLLSELQKIEILLKRKREIRWGPRTIDIDILLYDDLKIDMPQLTLPHPRMFERAFVLIPLRDIWNRGDGSCDSLAGAFSINDLIAKSDDRNGVKFYKRFEEIGDF